MRCASGEGLRRAARWERASRTSAQRDRRADAGDARDGRPAPQGGHRSTRTIRRASPSDGQSGHARSPGRTELRRRRRDAEPSTSATREADRATTPLRRRSAVMRDDSATVDTARPSTRRRLGADAGDDRDEASDGMSPAWRRRSASTPAAEDARRRHDAHRAPRRAARPHHPLRARRHARAPSSSSPSTTRCSTSSPGPYDDLCERKGDGLLRVPTPTANPSCSPSTRSRGSPPGCASPPTAGSSSPCPVIMWQIWRFVVPALHAKEKKYAIPFILSSVALFLLGGCSPTSRSRRRWSS